MPRPDTIVRQQREAQYQAVLQAMKQIAPPEIYHSRAKGDALLRLLARNLSGTIQIVRHRIAALPYCDQEKVLTQITAIAVEEIPYLADRLPQAMKRYLADLALRYRPSSLLGGASSWGPAQGYVEMIAVQAVLFALEQDIEEAHAARASAHAWVGRRREQAAAAASHAA